MTHKTIVALAVVAFFGAFHSSMHSTRTRAGSMPRESRAISGSQPIQAVLIITRVANHTLALKHRCPEEHEAEIPHDDVDEPTIILLFADPNLGRNTAMADNARLLLDPGDILRPEVARFFRYTGRGNASQLVTNCSTALEGLLRTSFFNSQRRATAGN
jgi:hypothetical protein